MPPAAARTLSPRAVSLLRDVFNGTCFHALHDDGNDGERNALERRRRRTFNDDGNDDDNINIICVGVKQILKETW